MAILLAPPLIFLQVPSLGLLVADATQTSYRRSPTGFSVAAIVEGGRVFAA